MADICKKCNNINEGCMVCPNNAERSCTYQCGQKCSEGCDDEMIEKTKTGNNKYPEAKKGERPAGAEVEQPANMSFEELQKYDDEVVHRSTIHAPPAVQGKSFFEVNEVMNKCVTKTKLKQAVITIKKRLVKKIRAVDVCEVEKAINEELML